MRQRILLIDCSSVFHAVKYSLGKHKLSNNDKPTFVIYGFLMKLQYMLQKTRSDVVVYTTDSKDSLRKEFEHTYKEKRHKDKTKEQQALDDLAYPQFEEIENYVISALGYRNIFGAKGYEADDILARICKDYSDCEIIMVTEDKDMYQCLSEMMCIFKPKSNQYYSVDNFRKDYGIEPKMWKRVKAIGGCVSDEVKGVMVPKDSPEKKQMHVAEKGALNFIKGLTKSTTKAHKAIVSRAGKDRINRNKQLVILPYRGTPTFKILPDHPKKKGLMEVCQKYNFKSIISDKSVFDQWCKTLRMY